MKLTPQQFREEIEKAISSLSFSIDAEKRLGEALLKKVWEQTRSHDFVVEVETSHSEGFYSYEDDCVWPSSWSAKIYFFSRDSPVRDAWGEEVADYCTSSQSFPYGEGEKFSSKEEAEREMRDWIEKTIQSAREKGLLLHKKEAEKLAGVLSEYFEFDAEDVNGSAWYFAVDVLGLSEKGRKLLPKEYLEAEQKYEEELVKDRERQRLQRIEEITEKLQELFKELDANLQKVKQMDSEVRELEEKGIRERELGYAIGKKGVKVKLLSFILGRRVNFKKGTAKFKSLWKVDRIIDTISKVNAQMKNLECEVREVKKYYKLPDEIEQKVWKVIEEYRQRKRIVDYVLC